MSHAQDLLKATLSHITTPKLLRNRKAILAGADYAFAAPRVRSAPLAVVSKSDFEATFSGTQLLTWHDLYNLP